MHFASIQNLKTKYGFILFKIKILLKYITIYLVTICIHYEKHSTFSVRLQIVVFICKQVCLFYLKKSKRGKNKGITTISLSQ